VNAFDDVLAREKSRLLGFIRRRVGNESDAEDLLQDVLYELASEMANGHVDDLVAWLFTVARNKIVDLYRRRGRQGEAPGLAAAEPPDSAEAPDRTLWRAAVWEELWDALEELPEEQRQVFLAHEFDGTPFRELAESSGEPINTLLSRKRYAILFLRRRLQELYDELRGF
jgi:RNA polymerase sigma factor (sigma-70 family)